jgi:chitinase
VPCIGSLWNWSSQNDWKKLAEQHDLKVGHKFNERIVNKQVNALSKMDSIVNDLQDVSFLALKKITTALKQDAMKPIENASELKSLVNSVTDAIKTFSLMTGGVSSRSETVSHNLTNKKAIREEIIQLMTSLSNDGIDINLDEDKEDKKKLN